MLVSSHCFAAFAIQLHCVLNIFLEMEKGIIQVAEHSFDISWIFRAGLRSRWILSDSDSNSDSGLKISTPTATPTPLRLRPNKSISILKRAM